MSDITHFHEQVASHVHIHIVNLIGAGVFFGAVLANLPTVAWYAGFWGALWYAGLAIKQWYGIGCDVAAWWKNKRAKK